MIALLTNGVLSSGTLLSGTTQLGQISFNYDAHGRIGSQTDARTGTTSFTYNNADRVATITSPTPGEAGASAQTLTALYNSRLGLTNIIFPNGSSNGCTRLGTGEPSAVFGALTYPVAYHYDYAGRLLNMTTWTNYGSGSGARTVQWNYDAQKGFLLFKTNGDGSTGTGYTYTSAGRLKTRTWARGTVATYSYDNGGEWAGVSYSDSTPAVTCGYDRLGNLSKVTNGSSLCSLTYDLLGNLTNESYTGGVLDGVSITNGIDALLRRTNNASFHTTTALAWFTNGYDAASRLNLVSKRGRS